MAESWPTKQHNERHLFLHPTAHDLFRDWDTQTRGCVTRLRAYTGTHPDPATA
jgi:MmyB-like transcription regulator ligand binding domain